MNEPALFSPIYSRRKHPWKYHLKNAKGVLPTLNKTPFHIFTLKTKNNPSLLLFISISILFAQVFSNYHSYQCTA